MHPGQYSISPIVDSFTIDGGENDPTLDCTVYPLLGQDITALSQPNRVSFSWELLRRITMHLLLALEYIHTIRGIVHTGKCQTMVHEGCAIMFTYGLSPLDIHYDNILIQPDADDVPSVVENFLAGIDHNTVDKRILFPLPNANKTYVSLIDFDIG